MRKICKCVTFGAIVVVSAALLDISLTPLQGGLFVFVTLAASDFVDWAFSEKKTGSID